MGDKASRVDLTFDATHRALGEVGEFSMATPDLSSDDVPTTTVANRQELERRLVAAGVPVDAYGLDGGHPNEAFVLDQRGNQWVVYYSERGLESDLLAFHTEAEACSRLLQVMSRDSALLGVSDPGLPR